MLKQHSMPVALTVAGSDSGGEAGIQADLKTFAALGVHGATAITCLTAQNHLGVCGIQAALPRLVRAQLQAVSATLRPRAVKCGMLFSKAIINAVAGFWAEQPPHLLVVDPVMIATSGARLLQPAAIQALIRRLFPIASLVTPNLHEAELLLGEKLDSVSALRAAARAIHKRYGCAALVKGGHLRGVKQAIDFFYDGRNELLLSAPFIPGFSTHGTGCTYSAAVAGYGALGCDLPLAVQLAKNYITQAIAQGLSVRGRTVLNHAWT